MASIVLRNFGGMAPSANPKSLPEAAATYVQNLDLRFGDFRPLALPAVLAAASAGGTLYKMEGAANFITRPGVVHFVRGPIANDATERTYYTGDGAPKVIDLTGEVRQLGVPAPVAAPAVQVVVNDEFSEADATLARDEILTRIKYSVRGSLGGQYLGLTASDLSPKFALNAIDGWLPGEFEDAFFIINGTMSGDGFIPTNPAHNNLNDPRMNFRLVNQSGTMRAYSVITPRVRVPVFNASVSTNLQAIEHPTTYQPFIKAELANSVAANIAERIKVPEKTREDCVARMKQLTARYIEIADNGDSGVALMNGQVAVFYARPEIVGLVNAAVTRAVSMIFSAMKGYTGGNGTPLPVTGDPDIYENAN